MYYSLSLSSYELHTSPDLSSLALLLRHLATAIQHPCLLLLIFLTAPRLKRRCTKHRYTHEICKRLAKEHQTKERELWVLISAQHMWKSRDVSNRQFQTQAWLSLKEVDLWKPKKTWVDLILNLEASFCVKMTCSYTWAFLLNWLTLRLLLILSPLLYTLPFSLLTHTHTFPPSNLRLRDWGRTEYRIVRNWTPREVREARNNVPPPPSSLARVSQQIHQEEEEEEDNESPLVNDQSDKQVCVVEEQKSS